MDDVEWSSRMYLRTLGGSASLEVSLRRRCFKRKISHKPETENPHNDLTAWSIKFKLNFTRSCQATPRIEILPRLGSYSCAPVLPRYLSVAGISGNVDSPNQAILGRSDPIPVVVME